MSMSQNTVRVYQSASQYKSHAISHTHPRYSTGEGLLTGAKSQKGCGWIANVPCPQSSCYCFHHGDAIPIHLTYYFRVVCAKDGRGGMTTPMTDYACDQRGERGKRETHGGEIATRATVWTRMHLVPGMYEIALTYKRARVQRWQRGGEHE